MTPTALQLRKSPRQSRAKATVEAILEAAARVLEDGGRERFNTNVVAERAGVSIGSLYQYFPGKDALAAALVQRDHLELIDALDDALALTRDAGLAEALGVLAQVAVDYQLQRPRLARLLDAEEDRLRMREEAETVAAQLQDRIWTFLGHHLPCDSASHPYLAADLLTLARAMSEGADHTHTDRAVLAGRIEHALGGYLDRATAAR